MYLVIVYIIYFKISLLSEKLAFPMNYLVYILLEYLGFAPSWQINLLRRFLVEVIKFSLLSLILIFEKRYITYLLLQYIFWCPRVIQKGFYLSFRIFIKIIRSYFIFT